jgi:3-oxoacyl-[acyl-carrier protein] reductase
MQDFEGRTVIVTGASRGMGAAIAAVLRDRGATVVVNDLGPGLDDAAGRLRELPGAGGVIAHAADVTDGAAVADLVGRAIAETGRVDVLVNNAGVLRPTPVIDIPEDEWDFVVGVNLKGTFLCSQAVLRPMRAARWGRIINLSSTAGKNVSTVGGAHYTAAKAAVLGFTRHLAKEEAGHGITVNAVCPGLIDTDMVRSTISADKQAAYAASFPISRLGRPEEVGELVAFLASDRAAYITGASLDINGGDLMI